MEFIDAEMVRSRLPIAGCIDAMATAMTLVSKGELAMPPRLIMPLVDNSGYFGLMPSSLVEPRIYGAKIVSLHPANPAAGRAAIQGFVALFDHDSGTPFAIVDGGAITALRTGAASGLATRTLARPDANTLGLFGCGVQATAHLEAVCAVRDIAEVRIWGRSMSKAEAFAETHADRTAARIVPVDDPRVVAACDILCTTTGSHEPVLLGDWVGPGTHVNLVGAHAPTTREADTRLIAEGRIYVDSLASAFVEAGEILIPIDEGAIDRSHVVGELGAVLMRQIPGRQSDDEITIYKSLGIVAQDIIAAHAVYLNTAASESLSD
ncbi:ornithine cyclodeaminase family protein [uncultured Sphingosinicella sp.]|uniref:ornithine cyclodeaminase family protein n=1 Tax=uncultured Sphingosinicella sp. TaxID=478748 RepID=UPI0030D6F6B9|tara:strand:- start:4931 stop:5896 length:966 start_codon:yes stop_codon:yes gene_type:complete